MPTGGPAARSRFPWAVRASLGVTVLVLFAVVFVSIRSWRDEGPTPDVGIKPIAIPAAACPYLQAVHTTAAAAGKGWADVLDTSDSEKWRLFRAQLRPKIARFDQALRVALPHVPGRVATELHYTLHELRVGRAKLSTSKTEHDYEAQTQHAVLGGYSALLKASELVGSACGFTLAPPPFTS